MTRLTNGCTHSIRPISATIGAHGNCAGDQGGAGLIKRNGTLEQFHGCAQTLRSGKDVGLLVYVTVINMIHHTNPIFFIVLNSP